MERGLNVWLSKERRRLCKTYCWCVVRRRSCACARFIFFARGGVFFDCWGEEASESGGDGGLERARHGGPYIEFFATGGDNGGETDLVTFFEFRRVKGGHVVLSPQRVGAGQDAPSVNGVGLVVAWSNYACALYSY